MGDEPSAGRIHVDSDWKAEAEAAKEQLAAQEQARDSTAGGPVPEVALADLINLIAMPAAMAVGGYATPEGQTVPPDLNAAKLYIDMLTLLEEKTQGNLSPEEARQLAGVLHQLRMQYAAMASEIGKAATTTAPKTR